MKAIVTGFAGLVGAPLCRFLAEEGVKVLGLDNFEDSYDVRMKHKRVEGMNRFQNFTWESCDITDSSSLRQMFGSFSPDVVVNLGGKAGVRDSIHDPVGFFRTNTEGVIKLLEECRRHSVPNFIQASTSATYGEVSGMTSEDDLSDRSLTPYGASKKSAEVAAYVYSHLYGINITIFRLFTVYAPAGRPDMAMFRFVRWICEGEPVTILGKGIIRDFVYVEDITKAVLAAMHTGLHYEVINLSGGRPIEIDKLVGIIAECAGREAKIRRLPASSADVPYTEANLSKAASLLNWHPTTSIEEGVGRCVEWYMANRDWARTLKL